MSSLVYSIALMLISAKLIEIPFRKFNLNPVIAYVLAGFIISNLNNLSVYNEEITVVVNFSIILIMLYTGLTTDFREIASNFREIVLIAVSGVVVTVLSAFVFLNIIGFDPYVALIIAVVLSNTATETVAGILYMERDIYLKSIVTGASFVDDIVAVGFVTIILTTSLGKYSFVDLAITIVKIIVFLLISLYLTNILVNKYSSIFSTMSQNYYVFVSVVITLVFSLAFVSKAIGLSEVIGAYIAGLILARCRELHDPLLKSRINLMNFISDFVTILDALFIPLFFTYIGLLYSIRSISINLLVPIFIIAIAGKVLGVFPIARYLFKNSAKALVASILMTGRGLLEIVLLKISYETGIIDQTMYSTVLTTSLLTVVITPILYSLFRKKVE